MRKFSVDLDGILYSVKICWFDEPHTHFTKGSQYSRERILPM